MRILIAGAAGQVGRHLVRILAEAGEDVVGLIRDPAQTEAIDELGGEPLVADLEGDPSAAVRGAEAVVFCAGAGPGSGAARKITVDLEGAVKLVEACEEHGAPRYVMVSSMSADDPDRGAEQMRPYLVAKGGADARLRRSSLQWTIVRPGRLTDEPAGGLVDLAPDLGRRGEVSREDVALVLAEVLAEPGTAGLTLELLAGDEPVSQAVARVAAERS